MTRPAVDRARGGAMSPAAACAVKYCDPRSALADLRAAAAIVTRGAPEFSRGGAGVTSESSTDNPPAAQQAGAPDRGSSRGPTVSETHNEASATSASRARRTTGLFLSVPEGINEVMIDSVKRMYRFCSIRGLK